MSNATETAEELNEEVYESIRKEERDALPVCPHCGQDPAGFTVRGPLAVGPFHALVIYCANPKCRKIHTLQVVTADRPRGGGTRIVKP